MTSFPSHPFGSPDAPASTTVVLVLVEDSPSMYNYWSELQSYYLPTLLSALQEATPDAPVCHTAKYERIFVSSHFVCRCEYVGRR